MCIYKVSMVCNGTPYGLKMHAESKANAVDESTNFMLHHATWDKGMSDAEKLKRIHVKSVSEDYHV